MLSLISMLEFIGKLELVGKSDATTSHPCRREPYFLNRIEKFTGKRYSPSLFSM